MSQTLPSWAVQRVATALESQRKTGKTSVNPADLARRTGLSKSLTRRCLNQLRQHHGHRTPAQHSR